MKTFLQVRNHTGGQATITVGHRTVSGQIQFHVWADMAVGGRGESMVFDFDPSGSQGGDLWYVSAAVADGPAPGIYESAGSRVAPRTPWTLKASDEANNLVLGVGVTRFGRELVNNTFDTVGRLHKTGPFNKKIRNVFLLMLENRSFDHLFGWSGLKDASETNIEGLDATFFNLFNDQRISCAAVPAGDLNLSADPGHEWEDVMEGLCGTGAVLGQGGVYPTKIPRSGFVQNYAKALQKKGVARDAQHLAEIMSGVAREPRLVLHQLAESYAVCDHWFCSLPGPTWPNRFFALTASSGGLEVSPNKGQLFASEYLRGFTIQPTIFSALKAAGCDYRLYKDSDNLFAGTEPGFFGMGGQLIAAGLTGVHRSEARSFGSFAQDLKGNYPYQFTFIEPHYGDAAGGSYQGGSSQHPMDDIVPGEKLIAATYNAIRDSPLWEHSLLIITYDEAGGLYDHVIPPANAVAPGGSQIYSRRSFNFQQLGPRVPAVIVSPWIAKNTIDKATYDHTSIIATVLGIFAPNTHLTERDRVARKLDGLIAQEIRPEADCPPSFDVQVQRQTRSVTNQSARDADPLPDDGNVIGFVHLAAKTDFDLSDGSQETAEAIVQRIKSLQTHGDARGYAEAVLSRAKDDETDGDKVDDFVYGNAAASLIGQICADVGMEVSDLNGLLTTVFATSFQRNLNAAGLKSDRVGLLLQKVEEYEANRTEIIDAEENDYFIPRGTSALLRSWS